jgi:hypothetical protein
MNGALHSPFFELAFLACFEASRLHTFLAMKKVFAQPA